MFMHSKRLMHTVRVNQSNPVLAGMMLEQFGGPQGELAAAMRYFTQYLADEDPNRRDMLIDIATEELSHLEVIGTVVAMLNRGVKGQVAEGVLQEAELYRAMNQGGDSHTTSLLYGGGSPLTNSAGVPWTAAYIDTITDPPTDLRSNIAAESRAKIIYERLINCTDDPDLKRTLGFLMTREIAHQKMFEKALYSIEPNFPAGKLPGVPEYTDKYYNMSQGEGDAQGPWNTGPQWQVVDDREQQCDVDGGGGHADVGLKDGDLDAVEALKQRTRSDPQANPVTGADMGAWSGAGATTDQPAHH
jgi:Mn-containing catalase